MYLDVTERCIPQRPGQGRIWRAQPVAWVRQRTAQPRHHPAEKAGTAMYEDDDDHRIEAAKHLATFNPQVAAAAFQAIACDDGVDDDHRMDAAGELARIDRRAAAEAFQAIACDDSVEDGLRVEAAERMPSLDPRAAAKAFRAIACDDSVEDGLRSAA